jgi:multidrug resistance protein, MATE family
MTRPVSDTRLIAQHAWPVLLGQLAVMAFGIVDTLVAGRYSNASLAALSVGAAIYISVYVALVGVVQSLLPMFAEFYGGNRWHDLGQHVKQATWLCLALSLAGMCLMLWPGALLQFTDIPLDMQEPVRDYLGILAWALPPSMLFRLFSTVHQSLGKPRLVTWLQVGGLCLKAPLSVLLTFGAFGLPELGISGCAWATFIVNYTMLGAGLCLLKNDFYRPLQLGRHWQRPHAATLAKMLRLGLPAGLSVMVEVTSFTMMALYIARLGAVGSAAHQIAANVTAVLYMIPLSLSIATSARVGYWLGAGHPDRARHAARCGFALLIPLGLGFAGFLALAGHSLAGFYTQDAAVAALTASLLVWVSIYHVADVVQAMCAFLLRCYRVTIAPFVLYASLLWGMGLMGGYWLCYRGIGPWPAMHSPLAFWVAASVALYLVAACLLALLIRASCAGADRCAA